MESTKRPEVGEYYSRKGQSIDGTFFKVTVRITAVVNDKIYYDGISPDLINYKNKLWYGDFKESLDNWWYHDKSYNSPLYKVLNG